MKNILTLFFCIVFVNFAHGQGDAPPLLQGQYQGTKSVGSFIQSPNNQITKISGATALIETGNNNILVNPSFEHSVFSTGWTNSAGTFTEETVLEIHGKKAAKLVLSSQTMSLSQSSTLYASQFADGVQGLASVRVKSNVALKVCSIQAGTVSTTNCVDVVANNKWGLYKVPMILGATSNGISINSNGTSVTGTVYIDDAFVGAVDLKADIDASKIAGESYFAGVVGCTPTRSSATIGPFSTASACPGPTIVEQNMGQWQTADADLIRQTVNNLPAGKYKATFFLSQNTANTSSIAINDGTTTCEGVNTANNASGTYQTVVSCTFSYTSSGNRIFEIYGAAIGGAAVTIANNQSAPRASTKFILEYFGSSSVYSSTNADTDWASCTPTSSQGFGTLTSSIQCKRQGSDLLMKGTFSGSATTAVEARLGLPLWNGVQLVSAGSSVIPSLQVANGFYVRGVSAPDHGSAMLIEPSVSYLTFGSAATFSNTASNSLSKANANSIASTETISFNARIPIAGWQNSNIIIGQFNGLESCTSTLECTDTFTARINSAGVISRENYDWVSTASIPSTGTANLTLNSGIFSVLPNCTVTAEAGIGSPAVGYITVNSTTSISVFSRNTSNALQGTDFYITCQKQGVDYIGKTAKAVASDQNMATPGVLKAVFYSANISSTVVSNELGDFINGGCTNPSAGTYICTFNSNKFSQSPNCTATTDDIRFARVSLPSTSSVTIFTYNTSAVLSNANSLTLMCHGVSP